MSRPLVYYCATNAAKSQLARLLKSDASVPMKKFIDTIIELQILNDDKPVQRSLVQKTLKSKSLAASASILTKREQELADSAVIEVDDTEISGRRVHLKTITRLEPLLHSNSGTEATPLPPSPNRRQIQLQLDAISDNGLIALSPFGPDRSRVDSLYVGILDAFVRGSSRDKRSVIQGVLRFGQERVSVTARSLQGGSGIVIGSDYRVVRAIDEMFVNYIENEFGPISRLTAEQKESISLDMYFDIYDLCDKIGVSRHQAAADQVRKILDRLASTEFQIDAHEAPKFREKFTQGAHSTRVRYLTEFRSWDRWENDEANPMVGSFRSRIYLVRFHSSNARGLLNDETRHIAHPELMRDSAPLAHRLNSWSKVYVGVRPGPRDVPRSYLLDELYEELGVSERLDHFCASFISLMRRECLDGPTNFDPQKPCRSLLYGYYIEINPEIGAIKDLMRRKGRSRRAGGKWYPVVKIWRDPADPIVGDNSDHNQAFRRKMKEAQASHAV